MDLKTLMIMFLTFTTEMIISGVMLIKHRLTFRFKPYISIPVGLLIAYGTALGVIFGLHFWFKPENWTEAVNIIAYTIPVVAIYGAFLFAYKIKPLKLLLTISVAYTFQHMAYQIVSLVLDTGYL